MSCWAQAIVVATNAVTPPMMAMTHVRVRREGQERR